MTDNAREGRPQGRGRPSFDPKREAALLSAYVDGELEPDEAARIEAHLASNRESRREVDRLRRLKEVTAGLRLKEAPPEEWEVFWSQFYNRLERGLGWFALTLGAVIVGGTGLYHLVLGLIQSEAMPWFLKAGIFILCFGVLMLLLSVLRERLFVRRRSRYRDVVR